MLHQLAKHVGLLKILGLEYYMSIIRLLFIIGIIIIFTE